MLTFDFPKTHLPLLKTLGADPRTLYNSREKFELDSALIPLKSSLSYMKATTIGVQKQLASAERLLSDPTKGHPLVVINSWPTDARAKLVGLNLMYRAIKQNDLDRERNTRTPRRLPMWVPIYNHTFDVTKFASHKPSMLVISNVSIESTANKMDRLRDLLEYYADIPRYIVTGGTDPFRLMYTRLFLSMSHVLNLGSQKVLKSGMELLSEDY